MRFLRLWNSVPVAKVPRGFLVAGSRRVVTSNWLVDDEAAASLIYCFCANIEEQEKSAAAQAKSLPGDFAQSLQDA